MKAANLVFPVVKNNNNMMMMMKWLDVAGCKAALPDIKELMIH